MIPTIFWMISIAKATDEVGKAEQETDWKGFSVFLHVILPVAGVALLWRQRSIFSKLLLQLDRTCVSVYCPSLSRREKLLKWASGRLPSTWSSQARTLSSGIPELWKDGSLLCTLINSVVPGACPNPHRHWRKPPLHAQALAYKYLGLAPVFTEDELAGEFTINQERTFINYLQKLQEAISRWSTNEEERRYSRQYVARGMGLYTGEQHRKTVFYLYSDSGSKKKSNVLMYIRGPYGTQGKATISPFHNLKTIPVVNVLRDQLEATKTLPFRNYEQKSFLKTISLDFTSLISSAENRSKNDEIPIQIDMEIDRAKVTYIPKNTGMYEINLISDGELLRGSPYSVRIIQNTSSKRDSFSTDSENVEEKITFTKRKILSKVIDCIDEKICIDNNKVSKVKLSEGYSREGSVDSDDDFTITAVTKKKGEILKTEINCTLENIIDEINSVQNNNNPKKKSDALEEIKKIAEDLKQEVPQIVNNKLNSDKEINLKVDTQHKRVKNCDEAKAEIINLLQQEPNKINETYNQTINNLDAKNNNLIPNFNINLIESTTYLKNIVNCTSKQEMFEKLLPNDFINNKSKIEEDENNNSSKHTPLKRITSKVYFEISPKNISVKTNTSLSRGSSLDFTSPICPNHIDPEVEKSSLNQLSLAEKRKIFAKQSSVSIPDCDNITFSTSENELSKSRDSTFRELSVLNVLDSLRQSRKNSLAETCTLSSATSLPNMVSLENSNYENNFKARKEYWEKLSSCSSSNISLANSENSLNKKKILNHKNLFSNVTEKFRKNEKKYKDVTKSVGDLSLVKCENTDNRKYKSVDTSLEDCTIISIEERKKQLLKNFYEEEKSKPKKLVITNNFLKKDMQTKVEKSNIMFAPISDRIQNFDKQSKVEPKRINIPSKPSTECTIDEKPKRSSTKQTIKSQFKRAIKFFKNLEENSKVIEKPRIINSLQNKRRRYSLDFQKTNNHKVREGGSLKLSNVSERFSINNLYEDVFGSRRGSFKGTPNQSSVASSLASLINSAEGKDLRIDESKISLNLFANRSKAKKRKSIKTLFDVNY